MKRNLKHRAIKVINNIDLLRESLIYLQSNLTKRRYSVMYSGHGSKFQFDYDHPDKPLLPLLTLEEAINQSDSWISTACTIGGAATLYDAKTNKMKMCDRWGKEWIEIPEGYLASK